MTTQKLLTIIISLLRHLLHQPFILNCKTCTKFLRYHSNIFNVRYLLSSMNLGVQVPRHLQNTPGKFILQESPHFSALTRKSQQSPVCESTSQYTYLLFTYETLNCLQLKPGKINSTVEEHPHTLQAFAQEIMFYPPFICVVTPQNHEYVRSLTGSMYMEGLTAIVHLGKYGS